MHRVHYLISTWLILSACMIGDVIASDNNNLPCSYSESINITSSDHFPNGSITFDAIESTDKTYTRIDYKIENGKNISVALYERGCICKIKKCIRICCPIGYYKLKAIKGCVQKHTPDVDERKVQDNIKSFSINKTNTFRLVENLPKCAYGGSIAAKNFTINNVRAT